MDKTHREAETSAARFRWAVASRLLLYGPLILLLAILALRRESMIEHFVFFPERTLVGAPADYGLVYEDVTLRTSDGVLLHGWFVPGRRDVTWLWLHGNAGNIGHRLENLRLLHDALDVNVFLFDYRGYGRSEGSPSEQGTYRDAEAAFDYLAARADVDHTRIVVFGRSLGCAIAVELASHRQAFGLVLESPWTSLADMARETYPLLPGMGTLVGGRYDSLSRIGALRAPLLVLHGDRDEVVPFRMGRRLYEAAPEPKSFYAIAGAGHNDTYAVGGEPYFAALAEFVNSLG